MTIDARPKAAQRRRQHAGSLVRKGFPHAQAVLKFFRYTGKGAIPIYVPMVRQ